MPRRPVGIGSKAKGSFWNWALWPHCLTYAAAFVPVFYSCGVPLIASLVALATLLVSHAVLDRRWLVVWWRRRIHGATDEAIRNTWWLNVVIDQVFHLTILCVIAAGLV